MTTGSDPTFAQTSDEPPQAVTLVVPCPPEVPPFTGRPQRQPPQLAVGRGITLLWWPDQDLTAMDVDLLTEVYLAELRPRSGHRQRHEPTSQRPTTTIGPAGPRAAHAGASLTVRVHQEVIDRHLATLIGRRPANPVRFQLGPHRTTAPARHWLASIYDLISQFERHHERGTSPSMADEQHWIVTGLLRTQPHNHRRLLRRQVPATMIAPASAAPLRPDETIGQLIRRRRHQLGLSQNALAAQLRAIAGNSGMNDQRISYYESGRHIPQTWLEPLGVALQLPLGHLQHAVQQTRIERLRNPAPPVATSTRRRPRPRGPRRHQP